MNIFAVAIKCMDASIRSAPEMAETSGNSLASDIDALLQDFRAKYEITETDFGNSDAWENNSFGSPMSADSDKLNIDIMLVVWDHIQELMLECGAGDVAREVFANEILNVPLSWDVREQAKKEALSNGK